MLNEDLFAELGLAQEATPEENIPVYTMDFANCYIEVTDAEGRTPVDEKSPLIAACYDEDGAFLWFAEYKNFSAFKKVFAAHDPGSDALLAALSTASRGQEQNEL